MIWHIILWVAVLVVMVAVFMAFVSSLREPQERREAFAYWVREQRGEVGMCARLPDRYGKYRQEFEAGIYPDDWYDVPMMASRRDQERG